METVGNFLVLNNGQFNAVYNALSFVFAAMLASLSCSPLIGPPLMRLTPSSEPAN